MAAHDTGYSAPEGFALIGPMVGFEPEEIEAIAVVAISKAGQIQVISNLTLRSTVDLLAMGQMQAIMQNPRGGSGATEPEEPNPLASMPADADAMLRAIFGEESE